MSTHLGARYEKQVLQEGLNNHLKEQIMLYDKEHDFRNLLSPAAINGTLIALVSETCAVMSAANQQEASWKSGWVFLFWTWFASVSIGLNTFRSVWNAHRGLWAQMKKNPQWFPSMIDEAKAIKASRAREKTTESIH